MRSEWRFKIDKSTTLLNLHFINWHWHLGPYDIEGSLLIGRLKISTSYIMSLDVSNFYPSPRKRIKITSNFNSYMTSFFRLVNKRAIYRLGIISLAHAPVHVTDFSVVNVHVDELSSARIWQHKFCGTLFTNVDINYRLPIKVYYRICTLRHIRIEIIHGSQNVFWVLTWVGGY